MSWGGPEMGGGGDFSMNDMMGNWMSMATMNPEILGLKSDGNP